MNAITLGCSEAYYLYHAGLYCSDDVGLIFDGIEPKCEMKCATTPQCSSYTLYRNSKCKRIQSCVMDGRQDSDPSARTFRKKKRVLVQDTFFPAAGTSLCEYRSEDLLNRSDIMRIVLESSVRVNAHDFQHVRILH